MPISRRALALRRIFRPRMIVLIVINVLTVLAFFTWRERYVTKESLLNLMDDRLKAVFSADREVNKVPPVVPDSGGHLNFTGRAAFASRICMPGDFVAVRALVHSLAKVNTQADVVVIVMDHIDSHQRRQLLDLGAKVVDSEVITVKIDESAPKNKDDKQILLEERAREKAAGYAEDMNKRARICRDNAIQAFRLTQWDRVLYMLPEMLVLENIDELFQEPPFAATLDMGGIIDESMLLLVPEMAMYAQLRNVMQKANAVPNDLGFLNYFFKDIHPLSPVYNVKARYQDLEYSSYIFGNARVFNFDGDLKPWDFWQYTTSDWRRSFNERMMLSWRSVDNELKRKLGLEKELVEWQDSRGAEAVCASYVGDKFTSHARLMDKYSVVLTAHSARRQETLPFLIKQFLKSENVDKVFIVWQKGEEISRALQEVLMTQSGVVVLLEHSTYTVNNKFNPIKQLRTAAVLLSDDDVWAPMEDIELAFETWKRQPDAVVGFAPRVDCYDHKSESVKYCWPFRMTPGRYSLMLTKLMFIDSQYLFLWRCGLPDKFQEYVDGIGNCEDIAMNFLIASVTGQPPMHVVSSEVYDFSHENGEQRSEEAWAARGECVQRMTNLFGRNPLLASHSSVVRYSETDFRPTTWDSFLDLMREKEDNARDYHAVTTEDVVDEDIVQNEM